MYKRPDGLFEKIITINGKRIPFRGRTETAVTRKILEYKGTVERGRLFKDVAEEWAEEHFESLSPTSLNNYRPAYARALNWFKDKYIKQIKPNEINSFIIKFAKHGYAQKTVSTQLLILNLIFSKTVVDGDREYNPCQYITIPKNLKKETREMPSDDDIEKVKSSVNCTFGLFAYFLLYTGCRRGEALALQYKDIDRKNKLIHINKSLYHVSNNPAIKTPKTKAGIRDIILLDVLVPHLPKGKKDDYIFANNQGGLMSETQFRYLWRDYCVESGINITPHQLRHAYASKILFEAGINVKDAQELLGHANISTTQDIYTHISKERKTQTADILNKFTENAQGNGQTIGNKQTV